MKPTFLLIIFLLSISAHLYGKNTPKEKVQQLSQNGIEIKDNIKTYTDYQYELLSAFDFNAYRNYANKRLVQIEDGPIVELTSLTEMQQYKVIPAELMEMKKNEISSTQLKGIITLINIGFRYGPKKHTETGF